MEFESNVLWLERPSPNPPERPLAERLTEEYEARTASGEDLGTFEEFIGRGER